MPVRVNIIWVVIISKSPVDKRQHVRCRVEYFYDKFYSYNLPGLKYDGVAEVVVAYVPGQGGACLHRLYGEAVVVKPDLRGQLVPDFYVAYSGVAVVFNYYGVCNLCAAPRFFA